MSSLTEAPILLAVLVCFPSPPPPLSPTAAAAAEGGGCVGAKGVVLGGAPPVATVRAAPVAPGFALLLVLIIPHFDYGGVSEYHVSLVCIAIFDIDYDAIISAIYALSASPKGDCYRCVPPDPGIEAAALGARVSGTPPGTAPVEALHTFMLDLGASRCFFCDSTTLTPLPALVPVRLADPSRGPVVARSSTVLPCPVVPSGSLLGLHLNSFSMNLVSTTALQDAIVTTTTPGGQRVSICTCTRMGRHLATFTHRPGSSSCGCSGVRVRSGSHLLLVSSPVAPDSSVAPPPGSPVPATPSWHTLPSSCLWSTQGHKHYFLLVVDDYTRYTTVLSLRTKGEVVDVLISWIRTVRLQLCERFGQDLPILRLHYDRGGEFSSDLLQDFCRGEGILESFTLPHF
ncbi:unnamed protein product [Closterium sp. NIES-53]